MPQLTPIQFNVERVNMTNVDLRTEKLKSASALRAGMTFIDPLGNEIVVPPSPNGVPFDIIQYIESKATSENGIKRDARAKDYVGQFEKEFGVFLKQPGPDGSKFVMAGRQGDVNYQWDSYSISVTPEVSPEDWELIKKTAIERFRTTAAHDKYVLDPSGNVIPFTGVNGKRALFFSEDHDNTGTRHFHVIANRVAFDMDGKEIATAIDWSKKGNYQKGFDDIKQALQAKGITYATYITGAGKDISNNEVSLRAQAQTDEQLQEAGGQGINPSRRVVVEVPLGNGETTFMAAPLTANEESLQRRQGLVQSELEQINRERVRLDELAKAKALEATVIEQAISAVASHKLLTTNLQVAEERLTEAGALVETLQNDKAALEQTKADLTAKSEKAEADALALHQAFVGLGTELAQIDQLGLDPEQMQALQQGNVGTLSDVVVPMGKKLAGLNEALVALNFPDDLADVPDQMQKDPFEGLNALLTTLEAERKSNAELTAKLTETNALNETLKKQVTQSVSDITDLKARMEKREEEFASQMDDMVKKVQAAESEVARAEGKVLAKQEQLEAEQAKVKELARTKDAIMNLMTTDDPHAAWEQSKDLFKDDIFANRAMGAFLRTASELEQAQQSITTMQAELVDLTQVRKNLEAAEATIAEQVGIVNDAGVADIRALAAEYKKALGNNATLEKQIVDLTTAAQVDQAAAEKTQKELEVARQEANLAKQEVATVQKTVEDEQQNAVAAREEARRAKAQIEQLTQALEAAQAAQAAGPALSENEQRALDTMRADPDWATMVDEMVTKPGTMRIVKKVMGVEPMDQGMQPAQGPTGQGPDYTKGLSEDTPKGPKKNDPDQGNNA